MTTDQVNSDLPMGDDAEQSYEMPRCVGQAPEGVTDKYIVEVIIPKNEGI